MYDDLILIIVFDKLKARSTTTNKQANKQNKANKANENENETKTIFNNNAKTIINYFRSYGSSSSNSTSYNNYRSTSNPKRSNMAKFKSIEEQFGDLALKKGGVLFDDLQKFKSYEICPQIINDGEFNGSLTAILAEQMGYTEECSSNNTGRDPTCDAIDIAFKVFSKLGRNFQDGPAYADYFVSNWGQDEESKATRINSCKKGTYTDINLDTYSATLTDRNGCNAYAFCDIIVSILSQSNNQAQTGSCGPTSTMAALSLENPVLSIQSATSLIWTGYPNKEIYENAVSGALNLKGGDKSNKNLPAPSLILPQNLKLQPGMIPWGKTSMEAA